MTGIQDRPFIQNILMVLQSDYPPDIRLTKEIKALTTERYKVFLLCNNKKNLPHKESLDGAMILRLKHYGFLPAQINTLKNIPLFINPVWLWSIFMAAVKYKIHAIHVHDLPLAMAALWIAKILSLPVVFDVHENYPAALRIWGKKGFIPQLFRNPWLAEKFEKQCTRLCDTIIVVAKEHKDLFIQRGVPEGKIAVVGNTVEYDIYTNMTLDEHIINAYKDDFALVYVGKFGPERDLETAIRAVNILREHIDNIKLLLVGGGPNMPELQSLVIKEGLKQYIVLTGWVDFSKTPSYIKAAKICIIPQPSNPLIDHGVPHKLYQYMALGRPVICSDAKAMARVVRESKCGEIFTSGSPESFADAVMQIYHSETAYGENGLEAVQTKHNWTHSSRELLRVYDSIGAV